MKQKMLTPAAGKRLIGRALAQHPDIINALNKGTVAIIAGTTNGYVAEEVLTVLGDKNSINRKRFFRGITLPPDYGITAAGRLPDESAFPGDVIIRNGVRLEGKTINDVADELAAGDIVLKGANALDLEHRRAAILIGNPAGGTIIPILQAVIGKRARLILPVGLEKRITGNMDTLARKINAPGADGPRFLPVPGEVFSEIDALSSLTGVRTELFAAGGVGGAEGGAWLVYEGTAEQEATAEDILAAVAAEPAFSL
jgi:hypothetical protein